VKDGRELGSGLLGDWCLGGLAAGLIGGLAVCSLVSMCGPAVMVNFGYPTDNPRLRFNIQIYVHFISDRIRV
jgi:hypothetical protein